MIDLGLTPIANLFREVLRRVYLLGWKWARHELQNRNATHPDLPRILRRIRELEQR